MSVTIKEIAKICGVSRGTVDRALNDRPNINPETKKRIVDLAEEMGYRPHFLAKSLSTGRTYTLGMIVFDLYNEFFASLIHAAQEKALEHGYSLHIMVSNKDKKQESLCLNNLLDRNVDGLIINSVNLNKTYVNKLKNCKKPCVAIGNRIDSHIPYVGINDYQAMYDATQYALSKDYDEIIFVCPPLRYKDKQNINTPYERYKGFKSAMSTITKKLVVLKEKDYLDQLHPYLLDTGQKTAFLCSSDIFALDILNEIRSYCGHIPPHVGIMGFDHLSILRYIHPQLSTVSYPCSDVGSYAVQSLLDQINHTGKKQDYILNHTIIPGETL